MGRVLSREDQHVRYHSHTSPLHGHHKRSASTVCRIVPPLVDLRTVLSMAASASCWSRPSRNVDYLSSMHDVGSFRICITFLVWRLFCDRASPMYGSLRGDEAGKLRSIRYSIPLDLRSSILVASQFIITVQHMKGSNQACNTYELQL